MEHELDALHGAIDVQNPVGQDEREKITLAQPDAPAKEEHGAENGNQEITREKVYIRDSVVRGVRFTKSEDEEVRELVQYAYAEKQIAKPKLANYIDYCLAAGKEKLSQIYFKQAK
jgi:hypothetical protein